MSAYTHMPYTQSALRDVDPSRPAHTHTHCRQGEELEADAGQSTILAQGYTGDSLGPRTQTDTVAATDVHSLVPSQAGSDSVPHTGYLRLVQSGPGFVPATAGAHLSTNQVVLIPHRLAQSESLLANVGRDTQAHRAQVNLHRPLGPHRKRQMQEKTRRKSGHYLVPPGGCGPWHRSVFNSDGSPIHDTHNCGSSSLEIAPPSGMPISAASVRYTYPRTVPNSEIYAAKTLPRRHVTDAECVVGASAKGLPSSALPSASTTARQMDTEPQDFEMPAPPGLRRSSTVYADVHQPYTPTSPTVSAYSGSSTTSHRGRQQPSASPATSSAATGAPRSAVMSLPAGQQQLL